MMKFKLKRFYRSNSKLGSGATTVKGGATANIGEIKWELRPGGMLVQTRDICEKNDKENNITIRVSTLSQWHDIHIQPTSTFGELKIMLSIVTNMEVDEQRLLYKGKEREDYEFLHMVGVTDKDKVFLLQDPAIKERNKLLRLASMRSPYQTISV